jgi:triacylglycerol lipase
LKCRETTGLIQSAAGRSAGNLQVSFAYVAYNMHYLSYLASGTPVAAIGHSQGYPNIQWALRFCPSNRNVVNSYVGLAPDLGPGISTFRLICDVVEDVPWCDPAVWQQSTSSNYYAALNYKGHQAFVPSTTIWTEVSANL